MNMKNTRKIMRLAFLAFLERFLTKRITLALAFVLKFVMISEYTPSKLPVSKNLKIFTEKVKTVKIRMSDQIFNDTTVEVNPDDANEAPVNLAQIMSRFWM
jgi:hypothetical protein